MKEEASDYLELETIKNLVKKYSQFINFPIYVWSSKVTPVSSHRVDAVSCSEELHGMDHGKEMHVPAKLPLHDCKHFQIGGCETLKTK